MTKNNKELYISIDGTGRPSFTTYAPYQASTVFEYAVEAAAQQMRTAREKGYDAKAAVWNPDRVPYEWPTLSSYMSDSDLSLMTSFLTHNIKRALDSASMPRALQAICDNLSDTSQTHLMVITDGYIGNQDTFKASLKNLLNKKPSTQIDFFLTSNKEPDIETIQAFRKITSSFNNVAVYQCAPRDLKKALRMRQKWPDPRI